jgi:hypothetical protein
MARAPRASTRQRPSDLVPVTRRTLRATALAVGLSISVGGCSGLEFSQDRRLSFTAPAADKLTHLPVTLSWSMKNYRAGSGDDFAVFIDQQPVKVGHNVDSVLPAGTITTRALLAAANVYVTPANQLTLRIVPDLSNDTASRQRHTATVVLLDGKGDRMNESAWSRQFDLPRSGS